jgi:hypothetical protein
MDIGAEARPGERRASVELIELSPPDVVRVHPRRARLAAIAIGAFAGLTCLGLATSVVAPRILDRRFDPRADLEVASARPAESPAAFARAAAADGPAVVATAAISPTAGATGGTSVEAAGIVHVSGAAAASVDEIQVALLVGGRARDVALAGAGTDEPAIGPAGVRLWSADVALPRGAGTGSTDGVAVVEVFWSGRDRASGGLLTLIVPLGDGRRRG